MAANAGSGPLLWYLTRTTAVSAYVTLSIAVMLGMLRGVARGSGERLSWLTDELHQVLATVFAGLVVLHLVALFFDPYLPFTLSNLLLPIGEPYRPLAVDLGVVGLYTMVVVLGSTWIRRSLPYRSWRIIHYVSFATFVLVTLHGLLAGSDTVEPWMRAIYAGASTAVVFLGVMRYWTRPRLARDAATPWENTEPYDDGYEDLPDDGYEDLSDDEEPLDLSQPSSQFQKWPYRGR
jgi:predicted ferric reductase